MKKLDVFVNVLICSSVGLWIMKALLDYNNYIRHVDLFLDNGWLWYTDALAWGKYIVPIIIACIIIKLVLRKK